MLASAVDSLPILHHYTPHLSLFSLSATLSQKIMLNHPYPDGNKRTALLAANAVLLLNGFRLQATGEEEAMRLAKGQVGVVTREMSVEKLGELFRERSREVDGGEVFEDEGDEDVEEVFIEGDEGIGVRDTALTEEAARGIERTLELLKDM